jgi:hypothetical protein
LKRFTNKSPFLFRIEFYKFSGMLPLHSKWFQVPLLGIRNMIPGAAGKAAFLPTARAWPSASKGAQDAGVHSRFMGCHFGRLRQQSRR